MPPKNNDGSAPLGQWEIVGLMYYSEPRSYTSRTELIQNWLVEKWAMSGKMLELSSGAIVI
jgi:hypothetical protein